MLVILVLHSLQDLVGRDDRDRGLYGFPARFFDRIRQPARIGPTAPCCQSRTLVAVLLRGGALVGLAIGGREMLEP